MAKITFLFWNIGKRDVSKQIKNLVGLHKEREINKIANRGDHKGRPDVLFYLFHVPKIDILILAENKLSEKEVLNGSLMDEFSANTEQNSKVQIFSKLPPSQFVLASNGRRYTVRLLNFEGCEEILLVAVHLPSKINLTDSQQNEEAGGLNRNLVQIEKDYGIEKTIVVGDFNMHPFDYGMISHGGFNSVMTRKIAQKGVRQVQFENYTYFYNPMWSFLGDLNGRIPGTLYRNDDFNWHLYDQLLIRPALLKNFAFDELEILIDDGVNQFLNKNGIINKHFSDHLPLKFSLNL